MYGQLYEILLKYVEEPEGGLSPETRFTEDLNMTSLDVMTMIGDVEDRFEIEIETKDLNDIYTIQDLSDYISTKVKA